MYDQSSRITFKNVRFWLRDLRRMVPEIPVCIVGNKSDLPDAEKKVKAALVGEGIQKEGIKFFEMSVKMNVGCVEPFRWLLSVLVKDAELKLAE